MPVVSYILEIPMVTAMPVPVSGIVILKGVIWGAWLNGMAANDIFTFS